MIGLYKIFDAHVHFYSNSYFKFLIRQKPNRSDFNTELRSIATKGFLEIPGDDPVQLAKRWIDIIDKWKLERLLLISSIPGDEDAVIKAIDAYPNRFHGIFAIDPNSNLLMENAEKRIRQQKMRGVILYPSMYHISAQDEWLFPLYNLIQDTKSLIFVHFGKLIMRPRDFAGIPMTPNEQYADPRDLIPVAKKFTGIRFIVPNFGAGKFDELLELGKACPNVYTDTAGSNSWMAEHPSKPDLRKVYQRALEVFGSGRILFGSDSGLLPRGYRYDIVDNQLKLVQEMRIPMQDVKKIFYDNLAALFYNVAPFLRRQHSIPTYSKF